MVGPVLLLLLIQVQFLPYHLEWVTWFQRFAVLVDFLVDFLPEDFFAPVVMLGLTTAMSFVPMGVPRPVQASQPGPALKPTGVPV